MLKQLKLLLGITDTDLDEKLKLIISMTTSRLKMLLGGIEPPEELEYIIVEVSLIRFNKIGSEGLTSHTVEGETLQFSDNDFGLYTSDIQEWLEKQTDKSTASNKGGFKFL